MVISEFDVNKYDTYETGYQVGYMRGCYDALAGEPVDFTLADHVEAIKSYLRENTLPDMTKIAFLADLEVVIEMVEEH